MFAVLKVNKKGGLLPPFVDYVIYFVRLSFISFLSWNYFGILFVFFWFEVFNLLDRSYCSSFKVNFFRVFLIVTSWHLGVLFWMFEIDQGLFGFFNNLLLHLIPFVIYLILNDKKISFGPFFFIPIWLLFEYFENVSLISFPWIILGNVFSNQIYLVQWYEFVGTEGGSLWLLLVSYFLFFLNKHFSYKRFILFFSTLILPILLSLIILKLSHSERTYNIDKYIMYNPEYSSQELLKNKEELAFYIKRKLKKMDNVYGVLIPETTFRGIKLKKFKASLVYKYLDSSLRENDIEHIFYGSTGFDKTSNSIANGGVFLSLNDDPYLKIKKKLVPYSEYLPKKIAFFLKKIVYNPFVQDSENEIVMRKKVKPLICYESFFSLFVAKNIGKANIIYLISSESFFKESYYGRLQYDNFLKLRTIETRLPLLKASYQGQSIYIDRFGNIKEKSRKEFNSFFVKKSVSKETLYAKYVNKYYWCSKLVLIVLMIYPFLIQTIKKVYIKFDFLKISQNK